MKNLKNSTKEKLSILIENAVKSILKEDEKQIAKNLEKAFNAGPAATREYLNTEEGSSEEARQLLLKPKPPQDGDAQDDVVKVSSASGQAMGYRPTQNFIDLMQSVSWPLGSARSLINAINTGPIAQGVVTSKDLIIDGHHRWSGAIAIGGGKAQIQGTNVDWPGETTNNILAAAQLTIAAVLGPGKKQPSAGGEAATNILGENANAIAKKIMDNINKQTDKDAPGPLLNDKMIKDLVANEVSGANVVYDWLGGKPFNDNSSNKGYKLRLAIAQKVGQNLAKLPFNKSAPNRPDMPQFDPKRGGPKLDKTLQGKLQKGFYNISPPYVKESVRRLIRKQVNEVIREIAVNNDKTNKLRKFITKEIKRELYK